MLVDAGEKTQYCNVVVERFVYFEGFLRPVFPKVFGIKFDMYTAFCQIVIIERSKGIEFLGITLRRTVASHKLVFEKDADLLHYRAAFFIFGGGYLYRCYEVFLSVGAVNAHRELRTGKDNGFRQVLEHKTHYRSRKRHRIRAVQHHETIVRVVVLFDDFTDRHPIVETYVR